MIRLILPAIILASAANAQMGACRNVPYSQKNCVRVLACVGDQGMYFDGQARGWDTGSVAGYLSNDQFCDGHWTEDGPLGTGIANLSCEDGTTIDVIYYNQDNKTGTVIGRGMDSQGRAIQVWSGEKVLEFLTDSFAYAPALPCIQGDIPIS